MGHLLRMFALGALCCACAAASPSQAIQPQAPNLRSSGTYEGSVDVGGGLQLHIRCEGQASPTVVFDAGLGADATAWLSVQPEVARLTRACAYDRAGRGRSGPAPHPHGQPQMARELYALLRNSGQPGPYVLVGHSLGGVNLRWFQKQHPGEVAGMVLVDAPTEDWPARVLALVPLEAQAEFWRNAVAWEGLDRERCIEGYEGLRGSGRALGDRPLVVLTAGKPEADFEQRQRMQAKLCDLSSNSVQVVAQASTHNIPLDQPALVIHAVRAVVQAARAGGRVTEASVHEGGVSMDALAGAAAASSSPGLP